MDKNRKGLWVTDADKSVRNRTPHNMDIYYKSSHYDFGTDIDGCVVSNF